MYISGARAGDVPGTPADRTPRGGRQRSGRTRRTTRVGGNVIALGLVSLVTDISSEMVAAVLPAYLMLGLGLSPFAVGVVNGIYGGAAALFRLVGGHLADRTQRRKLVAGLGYALSAGCKLALVAAGTSVGWIGAVLGLDRVGKGIRTAPRDALISLSVPPQDAGRAFGVHRAMDTAGALAGPLVAFAVLAAAPGRYDAVFVVSFVVAAAGLVVLVLIVQDQRTPLPSRAAVSLRSAFGLLRDKGFRRLCELALLFGLVSIGDAFVYLLLQRRLDIALAYFPLLPLGTAAVYLLLAVPLGRLADRIGRWRVVVGGFVALAAVYALLLLPMAPVALLVGVLACYGVHYAATDGVLMAVAGPRLPAALRTSGLALVQTAVATATLLASVAFGAIWSWRGPDPAVWVFLVAAVVTVFVAWRARPDLYPAPGAEEQRGVQQE